MTKKKAVRVEGTQSPSKALKTDPLKKKGSKGQSVKPKPTTALLAISQLKGKLEELTDQMGAIHGVLEEICERQEVLANWQFEFSKKLLTLEDLQWQSLSEILKSDLGEPVSTVFSGDELVANLQGESAEVQEMREVAQVTQMSLNDMNSRRNKRQLHHAKKMSKYFPSEGMDEDDKPVMFVTEKSELQ